MCLYLALCLLAVFCFPMKRTADAEHSTLNSAVAELIAWLLAIKSKSLNALWSCYQKQMFRGVKGLRAEMLALVVRYPLFECCINVSRNYKERTANVIPKKLAQVGASQLHKNN